MLIKQIGIALTAKASCLGALLFKELVLLFVKMADCDVGLYAACLELMLEQLLEM